MLFHRLLLVASLLSAVLALQRADDYQDPNLFAVGRGLATKGTCEEVFARKKYDRNLFWAQEVYLKLRAEFPTNDQCKPKLLKTIDRVATATVSDSTGIISKYVYGKGSKEGMSAMGAEDDIKVCSSMEGSKLVIDAGVHVRLCYLTENQSKRNLAIEDSDEEGDGFTLAALAEKQLNMSHQLEEKRLNVTIEKTLMDYQLDIERLMVQKAKEIAVLINREGPFVSTDVLDAIYQEKEFQYKQKIEDLKVEADKERTELKVKQKQEYDKKKDQIKKKGDDSASDEATDVEILTTFVKELYTSRLDRKIMSKSKFDQCMEPKESLQVSVERREVAMPQCK